MVSREPGQGDAVRITVENQNFKDVAIYALCGSQRDRLGLVVDLTTQTFAVPVKTGQLRVEVDFIAGDDIATEPIGVFEGDHIHVTIPPNR